MTLKFNYAPGATPLDPDEIAGLIPPHITTHQQLNEWEAANILKAEDWLTSTPAKQHYLTIDFIKLLHKKMFDGTWKWAGTFRSTAKNIGVDSSMITTKLKQLFDYL
jgi:fido (protein-threonine AMPylation protein)